MKLDSLINSHNRKWYFFYILLYISLIVSFLLGENSTGGAIKDYVNHKIISIDFSNNFYDTFLNYENYNTRHSPILTIFLSLFERIKLNDFLIRFIHLNICLILPVYFYKSLNLVIKNRNITFFLVSLIFISPTFRTLAIWPDSRLLGLAFFTISIYHYLKFVQKRKFFSCIKNIIFLSLSAYFSPNFSLFAVFYFLNFVIYYKQNLKVIVLIILINVILSVPAFFYLFFLDNNFLSNAAVLNQNSKSIFFLGNIPNNVLLISSIVFFYLIPFIILKIFKLNIIKSYILHIIISLVILFICINYFDYKYEYTGGGFFFKLFYVFLDNRYLFFTFVFISLFYVLTLLNLKFNNYILVIILIFSNPQITVYHKYYDPLLLILFFLLFNIDINFKNLDKYKSKILIFTYFLFFLIINNLKSYVL